MILHHAQGPFKAGDTMIKVQGNFDRRMIKVAIQCKEIQPTIMATNNPPREQYENSVRGSSDTPARTLTLEEFNKREPIVIINDDENKKFALNEHGILEFEDLSSLGITIKALKNLPAETSVDVVSMDIQN